MYTPSWLLWTQLVWVLPNLVSQNSFFRDHDSTLSKHSADTKGLFSLEEFDLNVETNFIQYESSNSLAETTFNSIILTVEIVTKVFNQTFIKVDDSWIPDNKSGWEHLETGLTIYKELRMQVFEYVQHRDEILQMLNSMKNSLRDKDVFVEYFMNFSDEIKFLTKKDLEDEENQEKMELTKVKILQFYSLDKIHEYLQTLTLSKTVKFQEMEKYIEYEIIDYVNSLNKFLFNIYFIIAQDEFLWERSRFIRETMDDLNYLSLFVHSVDAVVDLIYQYVKFKQDFDRFYRNILTYLKDILFKGERFSQILTDQIIYIRLSKLNTEQIPKPAE